MNEYDELELGRRVAVEFFAERLLPFDKMFDTRFNGLRAQRERDAQAARQ